MSERTTRRRTIRIAAVVLGGALALPGLAMAHHLTCDASSTNDCPSFTPSFNAGANFTGTNERSALNFRLAQPDLQVPVVDATYSIPKGWTFAVNQVRPAENASGGPATSCADIYTGGSATAGKNLTRAEGLGADAGMRVQIENNRYPKGDATDYSITDVPIVDNQFVGSAPFEFGIRNVSGDTRNPSVAFLNWNPTTKTATLCAYLFSAKIDASAREHILPIQLTQLPSTDPSFGWTLHFDTRSINKNAYLVGQAASLVYHSLGISAVTSGNWNTNPITLAKEGIAFSQTPSTPGTYEIRADLKTCAKGVDTSAGPDLCKPNGSDSRYITSTLSNFIDIRTPGALDVHDFGKLTGPVNTKLCGGAATCRFGIIRGSSNADVKWLQPAAGPNDRIKGYVLTVAEPGVQITRHFEYIMTDRDPAFDGIRSTACGAAGISGVCTFRLSFPLVGQTPDAILEANDKYDLALVTIYADGHRTDGRCDNGTAQGAACGSSVPSFVVTAPGTSTWEFLIRSDAWPNAFVQTLAYKPSGQSGTAANYTGPGQILLVDFALRKGELIIWNPFQLADVYAASSNQIIGQNGNGGAIHFGSTVSPASKSFVFDGETVPFLDVNGAYSIYNLKNPGTGGTTAFPTIDTELFGGVAL